MSSSIYYREVDGREFLAKIKEIMSMEADLVVKADVFEDEICFGLDERWANDDTEVSYLSDAYQFADVYKRSYGKINRITQRKTKDFIIKVLPGLFFNQFDIDENFDFGIRKLGLDGWLVSCEDLNTIDTDTLKTIDFASQNGIHFSSPSSQSKVTREEVEFLEHYLRKWIDIVESARSAGDGLFIYSV